MWRDCFVIRHHKIPLWTGYGESPRKKGRTYESAVEDLEILADHLGVKRFFLAGVSGGGPYALAAAALIPGRVRGILLLSAVGPDCTPLYPPPPPPPPNPNIHTHPHTPWPPSCGWIDGLWRAHPEMSIGRLEMLFFAIFGLSELELSAFRLRLSISTTPYCGKSGCSLISSYFSLTVIKFVSKLKLKLRFVTKLDFQTP